jgi:Zn-dependent protease with chaperone function
MKSIIALIVALSLIVGALWLTLGGVALAIAIGVILFIVVIFLAFAFGSWWSSKLMTQGAKIALQAQQSDDRRDTVQINALSGLVKEVLKVRGLPAEANHYPALPANSDTVEAAFIVSGLEDED